MLPLALQSLLFNRKNLLLGLSSYKLRTSVKIFPMPVKVVRVELLFNLRSQIGKRRIRSSLSSKMSRNPVAVHLQKRLSKARPRGLTNLASLEVLIPARPEKI
jgi:hypothetical protein